MPVPSEPFAAVYEDRNRLGVIVARTGRGGFEAYAADDHRLGLFPTPREAAAAITMARRDSLLPKSRTAEQLRKPHADQSDGAGWLYRQLQISRASECAFERHSHV